MVFERSRMVRVRWVGAICKRSPRAYISITFIHVGCLLQFPFAYSHLFVFRYCGHGAGHTCLPTDRLRSSGRCCSSAFLMGCSSGSLKVERFQSASFFGVCAHACLKTESWLFRGSRAPFTLCFGRMVLLRFLKKLLLVNICLSVSLRFCPHHCFSVHVQLPICGMLAIETLIASPLI